MLLVLVPENISLKYPLHNTIREQGEVTIECIRIAIYISSILNMQMYKCSYIYIYIYIYTYIYMNGFKYLYKDLKQHFTHQVKSKYPLNLSTYPTYNA